MGAEAYIYDPYGTPRPPLEIWWCVLASETPEYVGARVAETEAGYWERKHYEDQAGQADMDRRQDVDAYCEGYREGDGPLDEWLEGRQSAAEPYDEYDATPYAEDGYDGEPDDPRNLFA